MPANHDDERRLVEQYAQLLSLAAHEFRTPASVVGGYLRMLQSDQESPLPPRQAKMVDEAARSCARLVALISELSEVGKLDSGALALASSSLDLFPLLEDVARNVHEGDDREVRLLVTGPSEGAPVSGDRARVSAAFAALFRAILREQTNETTVVAERRVIEDCGASSAVVVIAREGAVLRAYDAPRSPLDEKRGGIGLALPIARRVIERHGGRIWSPVPDGPDDRALKSALVVSIPLRE